MSLGRWLAGPLFVRHISQFKKRPIAWQIETIPCRSAALSAGKAGRSVPLLVNRSSRACSITTNWTRTCCRKSARNTSARYAAALRPSSARWSVWRVPTGEQQTRKLQLDQWIEEMKTFDHVLEQVTLTGFGPVPLLPALRQYAINDALLSLTGYWLGRLSETIVGGPR